MTTPAHDPVSIITATTFAFGDAAVIVERTSVLLDLGYSRIDLQPCELPALLDLGVLLESEHVNRAIGEAITQRTRGPQAAHSNPPALTTAGMSALEQLLDLAGLTDCPMPLMEALRVTPVDELQRIVAIMTLLVEPRGTPAAS